MSLEELEKAVEKRLKRKLKGKRREEALKLFHELLEAYKRNGKEGIQILIDQKIAEIMNSGLKIEEESNWF